MPPPIRSDATIPRAVLALIRPIRCPSSDLSRSRARRCDLHSNWGIFSVLAFAWFGAVVV
eukprot:13176405-Alexandrium_andersonii.AAC.1